MADAPGESGSYPGQAIRIKFPPGSRCQRYRLAATITFVNEKPDCFFRNLLSSPDEPAQRKTPRAMKEEKE